MYFVLVFQNKASKPDNRQDDIGFSCLLKHYKRQTYSIFSSAKEGLDLLWWKHHHHHRSQSVSKQYRRVCRDFGAAATKHEFNGDVKENRNVLTNIVLTKYKC